MHPLLKSQIIKPLAILREHITDGSSLPPQSFQPVIPLSPLISKSESIFDVRKLLPVACCIAAIILHLGEYPSLKITFHRKVRPLFSIPTGSFKQQSTADG